MPASQSSLRELLKMITGALCPPTRLDVLFDRIEEQP